MTPRRRPPKQEPARCICEPGAVAHTEHAKPGKKTALHLNPECPHSDLQHTTKPRKKKPTVNRLRLQ